jgi:hypothetical protein
LRDDVEDGALALIFALGVLSFHDARPRGGRRDEDAGERRQKALDRIREEIARRKREGQKDRWGLFGKPDHSELVRILLWERKVEAAWCD